MSILIFLLGLAVGLFLGGVCGALGAVVLVALYHMGKQQQTGTEVPLEDDYPTTPSDESFRYN